MTPKRWITPRWLAAGGMALLNVLLPPQCITCDARVETQGQLCAACFGLASFITAPFCRRCGVPFAAACHADAAPACPPCQADPPLFRHARAALRYDAQARRLILPFKHGDRPELAAMLAPHMARAGADLLRNAGLLVPVPLHRSRLFHRRYNQAALLAAAVGRRAGVAVVRDALVRRRATLPLGEKTARERAEAVAGAFALRPRDAGRVDRSAVVLVDDVMTSGATANACAAVLLAAGAASVDVLVAARVPDPRLG